MDVSLRSWGVIVMGIHSLRRVPLLAGARVAFVG